MNKKILISLLAGVFLGVLLHKPIMRKLNKIYIIYQDIRTVHTIETDEDIIKATFVDDDHIQTLYQMLKDVTELFEKENITYSMDGGTMLGAIRHGGIIPWDDDIDLIILQPDEVKLNNLSESLKKLGYSLTHLNDIYKISKIGGHIANPDAKYDQYFTHPWIDIFMMHHNKTTKIIEYYKILNKKWFPNEWLPEDVFFPLKKYNFGPIMVYGFNNPSWYLNHYYGNDWSDVAYIDVKHYIPGKRRKYKNTIIKKIEGEFAKPALPKEPLINRIENIYKAN